MALSQPASRRKILFPPRLHPRRQRVCIGSPPSRARIYSEGRHVRAAIFAFTDRPRVSPRAITPLSRRVKIPRDPHLAPSPSSPSPSREQSKMDSQLRFIVRHRFMMHTRNKVTSGPIARSWPAKRTIRLRTSNERTSS